MIYITLCLQCLLCGLVFCQKLHFDTAVNKKWLNTTLYQKFFTNRHYITGPENKKSVREFIAEYFRNLSLIVELDEFKSDDGKVTGTNIIGIYTGVNHNSGTDTIFAIGAYYDTKPTPTSDIQGERVVDCKFPIGKDCGYENHRYIYENGAGVVALLEASRILVTSGEKQNTLIFVALDLHFNYRDTTDGEWEQGDCCQGARRFGNIWLPDYIKQRHSLDQKVSFGGAILLESILNYNEEISTQKIDIGGTYGYLMFKDIVEAVEENSLKGDFMGLVSRTTDTKLHERFKEIWNQFHVEPRFTLHHVEISLIYVNDFALDYIQNEIVQSDLFEFYRNNLKSILVTDTGVYRKPPIRLGITERKIEFLAKTIKTAVIVLETLALGSSSDTLLKQITKTASSTTDAETTSKSPKALGCPTELYDYDEDFDLFFKIYDEITDFTIWSQAKARCEADGAQLLKIPNIDLLVRFSYKDPLYRYRSMWDLQLQLDINAVWIGMSDIEVEGHWKWLDGSNVTEELWNTCQPDDYADGEDCGAFRLGQIGTNLIDLNCDYHFLAFICACNDDVKIKSKEKKECFVDGYTYMPASQLYYKIYQRDTEYSTWEEAEQTCQSENTTLFIMAGLYEYGLVFKINKELAKEEYFVRGTRRDLFPYSVDGMCNVLVNNNQYNISMSSRNCSTKLPFMCGRFCENPSFRGSGYLGYTVAFTEEKSIKLANIRTVSMSVVNEIPTNESVYTLDFIFQGMDIALFWHSRSSTYILVTVTTYWKKNHTTERIVKTNDALTYLSADRLTNKIYWSCMELQTISVIDLTTNRSKILFLADLNRPSHLQVDPHHGTMYWIESDGIKAASMDGAGNSIKRLIRGAFTHLSINQRNFFTSTDRHLTIYAHHAFASDIGEIVQEMDYFNIYCFDLEGEVHHISLSADVKGYSVANVDDLLIGLIPEYPVQQKEFLLMTFIINLKEKLYSLKLLHNRENAELDYNPCNTDSETCSYFCLPSFKNEFSCVCPLDGEFLMARNGSCDHNICEVENGKCQQVCHTTDSYPYHYCSCFDGFNLLFNEKSCIGEEEMLDMIFYTDNKVIVQLTPQVSREDWREILIENFETFQGGGIDIDPIHFHIYWIQRQTFAVKRAFLNGTGEEELISSLYEPGSITLDIIKRKIILSVKRNSSIETFTMEGSYEEVLHRLHSNCYANTIVFDEFNGYVYYGQQCKDKVYRDVYRVQVDTKTVAIIIHQSYGKDDVLPFDVDPNSGMIYWASGTFNTQIEQRAVLGTEAEILVSERQLLQYSNLKKIGDYIYLSSSRGSIGRINLKTKTGDIYAGTADTITSIKGVSFAQSSDHENTQTCLEIAKCLGINLRWICLSFEDICDGIVNCYAKYDEMYCGFENYETSEFSLSCSSLPDKHNYVYDNLTTNFVRWNTHQFASFIDIVEFQEIDCNIDFTLSSLDAIGYRRFSVFSLKTYQRFRQIIATDILRNVKSIQNIHLSGEGLSDKWKAHKFIPYTHLTSLSMSQLNLHVLTKDIFQTLPQLLNLSIKVASLRIIEPGALHGIQNCQELAVSETQIQKLPPFVFDNLTGLIHLDISYNKLSLFDDGLFDHLLLLSKLDLRGNDIYFTSRLFHQNQKLSLIYSDTFAVCCIKPSHMADENCVAPAFDVSSCENLIENVGLRICMWVIGFIALFGNIAVFIRRKRSENGFAEDTFSVLIGNLTISDSLMGLYLLMIASVDAHYRGEYIWNEYMWRNSHLCATLGMISVVSTEMSVFTISLITFARFLVVKYLFKEHRMSRRDAFITCLVFWFISIAMAVGPYFAFDDYYSSSGVCISLPLTKGSTAGWLFSFSLFIVFNFLIFLFIAIAQIVIIHTVRKISSDVQSTGKAKHIEVAKKLTPVIITDCACWIPIGTMGIMAISGYDMPRSIYSWVIVFVLPINSALNPLLYTFDDLITKLIYNVKVRLVKVTGRYSILSSITKETTGNRESQRLLFLETLIKLCIVAAFITTITMLVAQIKDISEVMNNYQHRHDIIELHRFISNLEEKTPVKVVAEQAFGIYNADDTFFCYNISNLEKPCFKLINRNTSWFEAEVHCQRFAYSYLVSRDESKVNDFLVNSIGYRFWIGALTRYKNGYQQFVWARRGNPVTHIRILPLKTSHCLDSYDKISTCYLEKPFICEMLYSGIRYASCPYSWIEAGDFCYVTIDKKANWTDAEDYCNLLDATLLVVESAGTNYLLHSALNGTIDLAIQQRFFIGISFKDNAWRMTTGEEINYANWADYFQKEEIIPQDCQLCVILIPDQEFKWEYQCCSALLPSICQKKKIQNA